MNSILVLLALSFLTHGGCTAPSINCPSTVTNCTSVTGCYIQHSRTSRCDEINCKNIAETSCATTPGCALRSATGGYCTSKDDTCYGMTTASACANANCEWVQPTNSGYCDYKIDCYRISEEECKDTSNNCVWKPNFCGGPTSCNHIKEEAKCKKESTGCEWSEYGSCQQASDLNCKNNSANTGCDASSNIGCWWQSGSCEEGSSSCHNHDNKAACDTVTGGYCEWRNNNNAGYCTSKCNNNAARDGCAVGSPSYCAWEASTSYCENVNLYCQIKVDGTGCTLSSDQGCKLYEAIPESCVLDDDLAEFCPLEGDSCGAEALSIGCVNSSTRFTVRTPFLLAFVAVLSLLLL